MMTFRIVAPTAAKGAAFKEDGGTNTGAVVQGESFYVENSGHGLPD
jgi:hypothetical protein